MGRELFPSSISPCTGEQSSLLLFSDGTSLNVMIVIPPSHGPPKSAGVTEIAVPAAALPHPSHLVLSLRFHSCPSGILMVPSA